MEHVSQTADLVAGIIALLLVAAATLAATNRLKVPFTVALLLIGVALAWLANAQPETFGLFKDLRLSADLILFVFLPALIFESAFHLDPRALFRDITPVLTLAVPGLLLSTFLIGGIVSLVTDIPFAAALLLGAILSATDPVAVIALFKRLGAPKRLTILVEGESLFNDATSIVLARILFGIVAAGTITGSTIASGIVDFVVVFVGGLVVGWLLGLFTGWLLSQVRSEPSIEITLTTTLAYLSFLLAEHVLHVSGVMATVAAGLTFGGRGWTSVSPSVRGYLEHFWEYMGFVATALIFLMVGLTVDLAALLDNAGVIVCVVIAMLISRAIVVYGLIPLVGRLPGAQAVSLPFQSIMYWGGLRGAIALAIILSLPEFEYTQMFTAVVIGAVLFTLLVQGTTVEPLMKKLGLDQAPLWDRLAETETRLGASRRARERIPELTEGGLFSGPIAQRISQNYESKIGNLEQAMSELRDEAVAAEDADRRLYFQCFTEEKALLTDLFNKGHLSESAFRRLLLYIALQIDATKFNTWIGQTRFKELKRQRYERSALRAAGKVPGLGKIADARLMSRIAVEYEVAWGHYQACSGVLDHFGDLIGDDGGYSEAVSNQVQRHYQDWQTKAREQLDQAAEQFPEFVTAMQERLGQRLTLIAESEYIDKRAHTGQLSHELAEEMQHHIEAELLALRGRETTKLRVEPEELLRNVPFFESMPESEFNELAGRMKAHLFSESEDIIRQGSAGDSLFLIARGVVRVIIHDHNEDHEVATLLQGDFFGEMALLHHEPRTATVRAISPCSVYELKRSTLDAVMQTHPAIRDALQKADHARKTKNLEATADHGNLKINDE